MIDPLTEHDDATPLSPDERNGLLPTYISLRRELNEAEHANILIADQWAFKRRRNVLEEGFLRDLHRRMFRDVWKWAGTFRTTPRNLGVEPWKILSDLHLLLDDVRFWVEHGTYPPDEIAVRFHHRIVLIHPFPNGNGRLSRLAADLLAAQLGRERFSWGRENLTAAGGARQRYIDALHAADAHNLVPLLAFVRS
jgi:Fic-DOC domain mobile mystery protein B